ncbi:ATP-grasp domain-containing protein [Treponema sp.]|uniref:ATP-grasp domain-containing protein n=1 Tax=Treponema sp. TaxID=166 RepID=UPI00298EC5F4|nr:ATP-grasp domain-containing protein [Treponema sp.]MCQ2241837.1 ATP-grasp domain-containing protein [Treponema sp.]
MGEKFILILGAGLMQRPSIEAAKELGYKTLVIDANPNAVCVPFADRFEKVDLKDREAIAELALSLKESLAGIFTAGTDFSASVSYAAEKCGLSSHTFEAALNASNKVRMRQCFAKHGIPSPDFFEADADYVAKVGNGIAGEMTFPKVVKPVDNMGARGCRLVRNAEEFLPALRESIGYSRTGNAIVEDYMAGPEFSIDALVCNGNVTITGFADRHIYFEPYFIELGHTMPSEVSPKVKAELVECFTKAVHALGLTTGVAKGDIKYTEKGPMIGEIAGRLSGGYMSGWTFPYSSDVNLTKEAMKIALGQIPESTKNPEVQSVKYSHERAFISVPGKIKAIYGQDNAIASPYIKNLFFRVKEGDIVDFPRNNVEKCGNVITLSEKRELSLWGAESAVSQIVLRLECNNRATDDFLSGVELPHEKGFPYSAFSLSTEEYSAFEKEIKGAGTIRSGEKAEKYIPSCLTGKCMRDWNYRTIRQTLSIFDRLCPEHKDLEIEKFWKYLLRGGIQAILYYADSME